MAQHIRVAIAHVKARMGMRLPVDVDQLAREAGHQWRERLLPPSLTVWVFALQILNGNCAINALRHLGNLPAGASSYCCARMKLPLQVFTRLFDAVSRMALAASQSDPAQPNKSAALLNGR